ncbi:MAG TPA: DUF2304 family protein [bacterium]|nr:DUF2304 family protein [bacterium]
MSGLRIFGIIFAMAVLIFSIVRYKSGKFNKTDLLLSFIVFVSLLSVSLNPNIFNFVSNIFAGRYTSTGRLLSILVISNFFLYIIILILTSKVNSTRRSLGNLVEALALSKFSEEHKSKRFNKKIMVVIPAYNEADNIENLLKRIPQKILSYEVETLVVVDGATDNTEQIVRHLGFPVVVNKIRRGGGAALRVGYQVALSKNAEIVVTLDADGQHNPEEIERLVAPIVKRQADFVSGSRILGSQELGSRIRQFGNFFFNKIISILLKRRITDCTNAFRALRVSELAKIELREDQFHTTELIIQAVQKGIRFVEVPVTVLRRKSGKTKKPKSLGYGWGIAKAILKTWWKG